MADIDFMRFVDELQGQIDKLKKMIGKGDGSSVSITPTLESGTKVADYVIDETSGTLYAPAPFQLDMSGNEQQIGVGLNNAPLYGKLFSFDTAVNVTSSWTDLPIEKTGYEKFYYAGAMSASIDYMPCLAGVGETYVEIAGTRSAAFPTSFVYLVYTKTEPTRTTKKKK